MWLVSFFALFILFFSFVGGWKDGAVKSGFSLLSFFIAVPLTGISYHLIAFLISFLPGTNWENFFGFWITLAIINVILFFVFLIPRKVLKAISIKGPLYRLGGGIFNLFNTALGLTLLSIVIKTHPFSSWFARIISQSGVISWLALRLDFVESLLPDVFQNGLAVLKLLTLV